MVVLIGVIVSVMCVFLLRMYTLAAVSPPAEQKMQYARDSSLDSCGIEQVML